MRMEQMYQDVILDHYKHPHGRGMRDPFDAEVHHVNPTCGDEITLRVALGADREEIADVSYGGQGCSISQASTSVLYDQILGRPVDEALRIVDSFSAMMTSRGTDPGDEDMIGDGIAFAGVSKYPARVKCALLGWMAFKDALSRAVDGEPVPATPGEEWT
ncbi:MAG TPA: SUF system NifU family Fe-S cluster assembly protein [Gordonia sp. (in: high G+C Gram-positive bacteria)]|uniref:Fe-S cluster assembly sulfur transfer protein SufU n=1 Tax=unclassified Gordonia (in: high G+C Gram-positive bacteria) TaxID=2657482 RepID=UPI000FA54AE5|nr:MULTISPECIES: SUF system NifU family Fe-S cluster assembly protein [unclassified Gordonia (in: high G+C Gram-positive bacteria)]RUP36581.1 MAG: SUF system NifU family Fe-S cluster assembly protein [Gordonia sp. (in: high G+C Gram-positive bacteria)]HNP56383.1 SUF system NifU family Fe-S cluster assembly protein [Gordonia sp. (in: high G+C Gram-positive bacteria)]HRC51867.1 SUF system NifU family Fe-S cluster assembly protein [Gordonia sp. (in: high G+C Gram-positive bacteria)]